MTPAASSFIYVVLAAWCLPLTSFITIGGFASRRSSAAAWIANSFAVAAFIAAVVAWIRWDGQPFTIILFRSFAGDLQLGVNSLTLMMTTLVTFISWMVHLYSMGYMRDDAAPARYFAWLGFFTFSMLGVVLSENLLQTFVFWELVGLSSYIIISHYRREAAAGRAATKAFIFNRVGDAGFLIGLGLIWAHVQSFSYADILPLQNAEGWITWAGVCIFCGVIGKSAQFPLFTWLPDAMRGPTPASALIHAATMVAAGVFLVARLHPFFSEPVLLGIGITGLITAVWAALQAVQVFDLKKILAWSTVSQLGFMLMGMVAAPEASLLHLISHAFFKAGLFLGAGAIIHHGHSTNTSDTFDAQDIRTMGTLWNSNRYISLAFLMCAAALAGIPFFSGFLSKEAVLTNLLYHTGSGKYLFLAGGFAVSFLTVFYTVRMVWFVLFSSARIAVGGSNISNSMLIPCLALAVGSLWFTVSFNPFGFEGKLYESLHGSATHSGMMSVASASWVLIASVIAIWYWRRKSVHHAAWRLFDWDNVLQVVITRPLAVTTDLSSAIDKKVVDGAIHVVAYLHVGAAHIAGWVDRVLVDGTVNTAGRAAALLGTATRAFAGGKIQSYIFWALCGLVIFILWFWFY